MRSLPLFLLLLFCFDTRQEATALVAAADAAFVGGSRRTTTGHGLCKSQLRPRSRHELWNSQVLHRQPWHESLVRIAPLKRRIIALAATTAATDCTSKKFDLKTALRLAGLAFDAYVEPPQNSSRWERGSSGLNVAFVSAAYTRQLYSGIVAVELQRISNLPADAPDQNTAERVLSGSAVDACLLAAILEGGWKEDVSLLETQQYHTGVLDLTGAAHVSRTSTCWSTVTQEKALASQRKNGVALPYHVPASFWKGQGGTAVWPTADTDSSNEKDFVPLEAPLYLYVQDASTARIVLTVLDDDKLGPGTAIGSTYKRLTDLIPQAAWKQAQLVEQLKQQVVQYLQRNPGTTIEQAMDVVTKGTTSTNSMTWMGTLPLSSKPRQRDKNAQVWAGVAAGAALAGPLGAAAGALVGSMYEGAVQGSITLRLSYRPLLEESLQSMQRKTYTVLGGMPGITWGRLYEQYQQLEQSQDSSSMAESEATPTSDDLEHCFFVSHSKTGATCAVYRSLREKLIIVSFRGTCAPIDLLTDASLIQEAWVQGDDIENQSVPKVHVGFRTSMNSISRRLKELILAVPAPGDDIADYEMCVTGHSLGAALATLFTADIGQYGIDAGRGLPQLEPSEPWWKSLSNVFTGDKNAKSSPPKEPPRPKALRLYNFGSPRVGNTPFTDLVNALREEGYVNDVYRVVNGEDVVARLPRTVNALVFGNINYDHVGATVLLTQPPKEDDKETVASTGISPQTVLWVEGESDDAKCPVRDGASLISPVAEGSLLGDLWSAVSSDSSATNANKDSSTDIMAKLSTAAGKMTERLQQVKAADLASLVGIDQRFTDREVRLVQSILQGKALTHHLEDEYYAGMGLASGFVARVGRDIEPLPTTTTTDDTPMTA